MGAQEKQTESGFGPSGEAFKPEPETNQKPENAEFESLNPSCIESAIVKSPGTFLPRFGGRSASALVRKLRTSLTRQVSVEEGVDGQLSPSESLTTVCSFLCLPPMWLPQRPFSHFFRPSPGILSRL